MPELLSPAGDLECLQTALYFGADAVYVGGPMLQLRAGSAGFSMEMIAEASKMVHAEGKKLYVTVNAFPTNRELEALGDYAQALEDVGTDAVIAADLGAIGVIRRAAPKLKVHVSTQANCQNYMAARMYADMGATRVVLGREMTLQQIRELRGKAPKSLELEAFVHGAMCMAWSGRCMLSAYLADRSANRGACTQSCRWQYRLLEEKRPGEYFPIEEDERGTTILSSRDLNCLSFLDQLVEAGIASFKIEGRMKSPYYVATVTNAYRRRMDGSEDTGVLNRELDAISHRCYSSGFYFGSMKTQGPDAGAYLQDCLFVGVVRERLPNGRLRVEQRNRIREGDVLEVLSPNSFGMSFAASHITDENGQPLDAATIPMQRFDIDAPEGIGPGDFLRIRVK